MTNNTITYGLLLGLVGGVSTVAMYLMGPEASITYSWINNLVLFASLGVLVYFGIRLRQENGGYFTYGQAYGRLMMLSVVSAVVGIFFMLIIYTIIDPDYGKYYIDLMKDQFYEQGLDEEGVEMAMGFTQYFLPFNTVGVFVSSTLGLLFYAVLNLLLALIVRKENPSGDFFEKDKEDILA